jgi:hypothetical protein
MDNLYPWVYLTGKLKILLTLQDKAKPAVRRGRKATGLYEIAGLPGARQRGFFLLHRRAVEVRESVLPGKEI